MPAKDLAAFPIRLAGRVRELLTDIGVPDEKIEAEILEMKEISFAKTASRQILGSMNDFTNILEVMLEAGDSLDSITAMLGDTPCSPIGMSSPIEETARLFQVNVRPKAPRQPLRLIKSEDC